MPLANVVSRLHSDVSFFWLLTFSDPTSNVELRAVSNLEDVTSRGNLYKAFPFEVTLPPDDGTKPQNAQVRFPNVGRELMDLVRRYQPDQRPNVLLELVLSSSLDTVEKRIDFLTLADASYDALSITFTLAYSNIFERKTSGNTYDAYEWPGLFFALK